MAGDRIVRRVGRCPPFKVIISKTLKHTTQFYRNVAGGKNIPMKDHCKTRK